MGLVKATGVVSNTQDEGWVLEVTEREYRRVMGTENWRMERAIRQKFPDEEMPWIIDMATLLMHKGGISYGDKVTLNIEFNKLK